jgi:hypothetical protein
MFSWHAYSCQCTFKLDNFCRLLYEIATLQSFFLVTFLRILRLGVLFYTACVNHALVRLGPIKNKALFWSHYLVQVSLNLGALEK